MAAPSTTIETPSANVDPKTKKESEKFTYMLHNMQDLSCLGKYKATHHRYAALKVTSAAHRAGKNNKLRSIVDANGVAQILIRQTNTRVIRKYEGRVVPLKEPKIVKRGNEEVVYTRKPTATYVGDLDINLTNNLTSLEADTDVPLAHVPADKKQKTGKAKA
jgi:hypothetical protein